MCCCDETDVFFYVIWHRQVTSACTRELIRLTRKGRYAVADFSELQNTTVDRCTVVQYILVRDNKVATVVPMHSRYLAKRSGK